MLYVERPVSHVKLRPRIREDLGDIDGLAADIQANGLLQPIVTGEDGYLIAGFRRLEAHRKAGLATIQCHVVRTEAEGACEEELEREVPASLRNKGFSGGRVRSLKLSGFRPKPTANPVERRLAA